MDLGHCGWWNYLLVSELTQPVNLPHLDPAPLHFNSIHPALSFIPYFQTTLRRAEVFRSTAEKFQCDVDHILDCEMRLLNQVVVARDDSTGFFNLAVVSDRLRPPSHHFVIEWPDGRKAVQPRYVLR